MITTTIKRSTTSILISLIFTSVFLLSNTYSSASARVPIVEGGNSMSKFILNIDGLDYSTLKAQVWVTAGSITISKIINPVSLLDPTDDNKGLIQVPLEFKKGLIKTGERFTACIKVLYDADKYGDHLACQKGIVGSSNTQSFQPQLAGTTDDGNNNDIVVRMSL